LPVDAIVRAGGDPRRRDPPRCAYVTTILGIDAAWTAGQPSGVALVRRVGSTVSCLCVAPSYRAFVAAAAGVTVNWRERPAGSLPDAAQLLAAARAMAGAEVDVVAIDMPVSTVPLLARRAAETEVSRRFGSRGCSTHSPLPGRPGALGANLTNGFVRRGYAVATTADPGVMPCRLLEVYPHVALLALLRRRYRLPYKAGKSTDYWPRLSHAARVQKLIRRYRRIHDALSAELGPLPLELPAPGSAPTLSQLKRHEDGLDALVCCWIGLLYAAGRAHPLGDATAAVWIPAALLDGPG
jgi:predicted RNase H-like nuclease